MEEEEEMRMVFSAKLWSLLLHRRCSADLH